MLTNFASIKQFAKLKNKLYSIDNLAFKFHYRITFLILLTSTVLVTSQSYIGEHIRCIQDGSIPVAVIETFCFFTSTFTVVRHNNATSLATGEAIHPGVGPMYLEDPVQHHAYYQWVPFVLFLQALMFYVTHMLWRSWECGKIKSLVEGLHFVELAKFNRKDSNIDVGNIQILSKSVVDGRVAQLRLAVVQHLDVNRYWALWLILCEILNLLNVVFQVYLTDRFLQGKFLELGIDVLHDAQSQMTTLDLVFPKMTKCFFHKYGASGSLQQHDTLCVMALNIINEKIFIFLWFWYIILLFVSLIPLLWRLVSMICHSRSHKFNGIVFSFVCPGHLRPSAMSKAIRNLTYSQWLFLYYLAKNLHSSMFQRLLDEVAEEYEEIDYDSIDDVDDETDARNGQAGQRPIVQESNF